MQTERDAIGLLLSLYSGTMHGGGHTVEYQQSTYNICYNLAYNSLEDWVVLHSLPNNNKQTRILLTIIYGRVLHDIKHIFIRNKGFLRK